MYGIKTGRRGLFLTVLAALLFTAPAEPQGAPRLTARPQPEPIAETRLLMEGIAMPNYRGLENLLRQAPADNQGWTFARGQALLLAEAANLLMLRPPHNAGEAAWLDRAAELRTSATRLARAASNRDFPRSRAHMHEVAAACNRCHRTFRIDFRLNPFEDKPPAPAR